MKRKTGLSLNASGWGLVEIRRLGEEERLERVQRGEWRSDDPVARGIELRQVGLESRISSPVTVSLTMEAVLWTTLDLPLVPEKDIEAAIRGSWDDLRTIDDPAVAYQVLSRFGGLKLRAGAIRRSELNVWIDLLENAGIDPAGIVLQAQAVSRVLLCSQEPSLYILADNDRVELGIASQGVPVLHRTIAWDTGSIEDIKQELGFTRHAWARQGGPPPHGLLALPPEVLSDPSDVAWADEILITPKTPKTHGCLDGHLSLIAAYGAAGINTEEGVWHPNLPSVEQRQRVQLLLLAVASIALFVLGGFCFHRARVQTMGEQSRWVRSHLTLYRELERIEAQDEEMIATLSQRQRLWNDRRFTSRMLNRWQRMVPPGTVLNQWMMDGMRVLEISGRTPSISRLIEVLGTDPVFKDLALKGTVYHNPKGWDEFRLAGTLVEEVSPRDELGTQE